MTLLDCALAFVGLRNPQPPWPPRRLSLALQGGGSFGAFTWGVLERLLEERVIAFDAVSGSSAGAVNAVLLASGLADGGRAEATARLERFWRRMSASAAFLPSTALAGSPVAAGFGLIIRALSPYQLNPFNLNPLREALVAEVDFARLRDNSPLRLLIAATKVRDGRSHIFADAELTVDAVLASACLPLLHHTVEIDGEPYWDGGYAANPPLLPLVQASDAPNVLIVQATPTKTERPPTTAREIAHRLEQIHFNATLNAELDALRFGIIAGATPKLRRLRIGRISAQDEFEGLEEESAVNLGWEFLQKLRESGRRAVEAWLTEAAPREAA
ncbi:MAG: patatin-like phospholipase family protein [Hyphomicrobiales bacterium]|nr:patatin-like phospholipase family protein [Hyphomicrobiales bacterium]